MGPKFRRSRRCFSHVSIMNDKYLRELNYGSVKRMRASMRHRKLQEYDLEQKIDLEIKMREGTTKLLAACKHSNQTLEAAKSLLTSNERMNAYMNELQRRRAMNRDERMKFIENVKAKVSVSDIRMPLIWKDTDHFKNKGDYRRFAVFCLLKIGTEIYDTQMISSVDRSMTDITFDDICVFNSVPSNFEFKLEVYSRVHHDDLSIASTPRKLTKKISTSVSRTLGRKMASAVKDDLESENGPKFHLVAQATLRLGDSAEAIKTHDLNLENLENRHSQLPLFGHFCCRLAVQPDCAVHEKISGYLKVKEANARNSMTMNSIANETIYWAKIKNFHLQLWLRKFSALSDDRLSDETTPDIQIPINDKTKLKVGVQALTVHNQTAADDSKCWIISTITKNGQDIVGDIKLWAVNIEEAIQDYKQWEPVSSHAPMDIPSPLPSRAPMFMKPRAPGTLYDETPIHDAPLSSPMSCYPHNGTISSSTSGSSNPRRISPSESLRSRSSSMSSSGNSNSESSMGSNGHKRTSPSDTYNNRINHTLPHHYPNIPSRDSLSRELVFCHRSSTAAKNTTKIQVPLY